MTNQHHKHTPPHDGPLPPVPPIGPPTKKITGFWAAITVLLASATILALKTSYQVCAHYMTWDVFTSLSAWTKLVKLTFNGFVYGLIPGTAFGLLTIAIACAGPSVWTYVGPILVTAAANTMRFVRGMSLAFRGKPASPETPDNNGENNG
jgi:hypothetical protein